MSDFTCPSEIRCFYPTIKISLDPDQAGHNVGPDLCPNCLQSCSADDTSRQRVNV